MKSNLKGLPYGSSGVKDESATDKRSNNRSGRLCFALCLPLSTFQVDVMTGSEPCHSRSARVSIPDEFQLIPPA